MRLNALDSFRGIAAVLVVAHHTLECLGPLVSDGFQNFGVAIGQASVWFFFMLSGFVLGSSFARGPVDVSTYLVARLIRLYLPVFFAVVMTAVSQAIVPRTGLVSSPWVAGHPNSYTIQTFLQDATLLSGVSGNLAPLWSMRWEVYFSLLLPAGYFVFARLNYRFGPFLVLVAMATIAEAIGSEPIMYVSIFLLGMWIQTNLSGLSKFFFEMQKQLFLPRLTLTGIAAATTYGLSQNPFMGWGMLQVFVCLLLFVSLIGIVAVAPEESNILLLPPMLWLGKTSFSLYLVHEFILVSFTYIGHGSAAWIWSGALISIGFAGCFYYWIERPSHLLAKRISASS